MFFFFFDPITDKSKFQVGSICEILSVHHPSSLGDIGKKIVITQISPDSDLMWGHEAKARRYRINKKGNRVCEFDPKCVLSLYDYKRLRILGYKEAQEIRYLISDNW